uniref:Protein SHQ1 homolog n=1 Tax=Magallana gigas TaxID=29159 RepID=K1QHE0_MAGGI
MVCYLLSGSKFHKIMVTDTEIFIEDDEFRFHSKPYFLRLCLPGNIVENGHEKANYDSSKGIFTIVVPKESPGEMFEGLDMLTSLLTPKSQKLKKPVIEVIKKDEDDKVEEEAHSEEEEEEEFDWHVEQHPYKEKELLLDSQTYGFANQKSGIFKRLQVESGWTICKLSATLSWLETFSSVSDVVRSCIRRSLCYPLYRHWDLSQTVLQDVHNILAAGKQQVLKCLLDIHSILGSSYPRYILNELYITDYCVWVQTISNKRLKTLASALEKRTISKEDVGFELEFIETNSADTEKGDSDTEEVLVGSLKATFSSVSEVVRSCIRRSLCYPLYRHWDLSQTVLQDVHSILAAGKQQVLKCLLDIHSILGSSYPRYILNDLYITDYCVWVQTISNKRLKTLASALEKRTISKEDVGFELEFIETNSADTEKGDSDTEEVLVDSLKAVSINQAGSDSDDDSEVSDNDSSEDSDDVSDDCAESVQSERISNSQKENI